MQLYNADFVKFHEKVSVCTVCALKIKSKEILFERARK